MSTNDVHFKGPNILITGTPGLKSIVILFESYQFYRIILKGVGKTTLSQEVTFFYLAVRLNTLRFKNLVYRYLNPLVSIT